jgi:hypothetical protein
MSGFAVLVQPDSTVQSRENTFRGFAQLIAQFKRLDLPAEQAVGGHCIVAKLDSPSSLHRGITRDETTGSWLVAAGTVVSLTDDSASDTSLNALLRDYLEHGVDALQRYDGHFALVIYDGREESLSVISDPLGFFSIFYGSRGDQIFIASSALAVARQIHCRPDTLTIEHFLRMGRVDGEKTLWQDVKRLLPARVLRFTCDKVEELEYWAPTVDETTSRLSFDDALRQAVDVLSRTFKRTLQREGKVWADLTGGFDSRLTTMLMDKIGIPFIAYCVGPADLLDVKLSRLISQEMGWEYRHMPLPDTLKPEQYTWFETAIYKGDGQLDAVQLAYVLRGHQERSAMNMILVGGAGGENLRGYYWLGELFNIGRTVTVNYDRLLDHVFSGSLPMSIMSQDRTTEVRHELREFIERLLSRYSKFPNTVKLDRFEIYRDAGHGGAYLSAVTGIVRSLMPLCFKEPVNLAFSLNYKWKLPRHQLFIRALLEQENPRLANIVTTTGEPAIPMRVTNIHRFWPLWKGLVNEATSRLSKKLVGKPIAIWPQKPDQAQFLLPTWRKAFLNFAVSEGLLTPAKMHSGALYRADALQTLVSQVETAEFKHEEFLRRAVTVEMALRATGASVE